MSIVPSSVDGENSQNTFSAEEIITNLMDDRGLENIARLNFFSIEETLDFWEAIEARIARISSSEEGAKKNIEYLEKLRQKNIFNLLEDSENGLLDMFGRELYPETKLGGASIREPLWITIWPEHGTGSAPVQKDQITLKVIKKLHERLRLGGGIPKKVTKEMMKVSNATLAIQELTKTIEGLKPENNMVLYEIGKAKDSALGLLNTINNTLFSNKSGRHKTNS